MKSTYFIDSIDKNGKFLLVKFITQNYSSNSDLSCFYSFRAYLL